MCQCEPDWRGSREIDLALRTRQKPGEPQRNSQVILSPRPQSHSLVCSRGRRGPKKAWRTLAEEMHAQRRRGAKIKKSLKGKRALI